MWSRAPFGIHKGLSGPGFHTDFPLGLSETRLTCWDCRELPVSNSGVDQNGVKCCMNMNLRLVLKCRAKEDACVSCFQLMESCGFYSAGLELGKSCSVLQVCSMDGAFGLVQDHILGHRG